MKNFLKTLLIALPIAAGTLIIGILIGRTMPPAPATEAYRAEVKSSLVTGMEAVRKVNERFVLRTDKAPGLYEVSSRFQHIEASYDHCVGVLATPCTPANKIRRAAREFTRSLKAYDSYVDGKFPLSKGTADPDRFSLDRHIKQGLPR